MLAPFRACLTDVKMLSLTAASYAYAPTTVMPSLASAKMTAIRPGDIGTTKPLGVYDPLNLMTSMPDKYRRWQARCCTHTLPLAHTHSGGDQIM